MMRQLTAKRLSTSLYDVETFETLIRVSVWTNPETLEVHPEDDGESPTVRVKFQKGRMTYYGTVDREALAEVAAREAERRQPPLVARRAATGQGTTEPKEA